MARELFGDARSDLVEGDLLDVCGELRFVNIGLSGRVGGRPRVCRPWRQAHQAGISGVGSVPEQMFQPRYCVVFAGRENRHGAAKREEQVLLDGGTGQVSPLPVNADNVSLLGLGLVGAVVVAAGNSPMRSASRHCGAAEIARRMGASRFRSRSDGEAPRSS
jgi:hypothetical protein